MKDSGLKPLVAIAGVVLLILLVVTVILLLPLAVVMPLARLLMRLILQRKLVIAGFMFNLVAIAAYLTFRKYTTKWYKGSEDDDIAKPWLDIMIEENGPQSKPKNRIVIKVLQNGLTLLIVSIVVASATWIDFAYHSDYSWLEKLDDYIWALGTGILAERVGTVWDRVTSKWMRKRMVQRGIQPGQTANGLKELLEWMKKNPE